jgi:hypothetical protein
MNATNLDTLSVIFKVMGASLVLSIAIKYLAPFAEIEPTTFNVLVAVLSPTAILAIVLLLSKRV